MREKSDASKLREKRGIITADQYTAWKMACETRSWGKASMIHDPVVGRTVHTLSNAETKTFWYLRFIPEVEEIYEQFPLRREEVTAIGHSLGMPAYASILSTDFLVRMKENKYLAINVKDDRGVYDPQKNRNYKRDIKRLKVEKIYWGMNYGIPLKAVFGNEINSIYVNNIKNILHFYDRRAVTNRVSIIKFLLAHHVIEVPMENEYIRFGDIIRDYDVEGLYEAYCEENR